ncbi:MAG: hypothetical protein KTR20_14030 [Cellvibrionaceae bacterium]|nr:hypothetical protein [Cellvibrionaceae bacterium]
MKSQQTLDALQQLYADKQWPIIHSGRHTATEAVLSLGIREDLYWFSGHFPEQPVLPGVVQTHWAGVFSRHLFPAVDGFAAIRNLKFNHVILPGAEISLQLSYQAQRTALSFAFTDDNTAYSSGILQFA